MGLVIARFINGNAGPGIAAQYIKEYQPSELYPKPRVIVAIAVLCTDTEEKAAQLRKLSDHNLLKFEQGLFEPLTDYAEIADYKFTPDELGRIHNNRGRIVSGTPEQVKKQLTDLAADFHAEEIIITAMTFSQEDRIRSFTLLADAFELGKQ
jgi:alkanesulfonate monooxygenase SsuD/methylene tetrahydromethanopterin reductase-like flavin-dependent oxidoreductase (luciferase family)